MNDRAVIRGLIRQGAQINIIGDSLAAGAGSSDSYSTEEVILHDGDDVFVRRAAPNSWWSRFQNYIDDKYPGCTVVNNGCGGAFSFQLKNHLPSVFQEDKDDIIFLFLGANDRKRVNGMDELRSNLTWMIRYFKYFWDGLSDYFIWLLFVLCLFLDRIEVPAVLVEWSLGYV